MPIGKLCTRCRVFHPKNEKCPRDKNRFGDYHGPRFRGSASSRGYDARWREVRLAKLTQDPLCEDHLRKSNNEPPFVPANEVHHIKKVTTHPLLRLEMSNLMSLCKECHNKRTARGE